MNYTDQRHPLNSLVSLLINQGFAEDEINEIFFTLDVPEDGRNLRELATTLLIHIKPGMALHNISQIARHQKILLAITELPEITSLPRFGEEVQSLQGLYVKAPFYCIFFKLSNQGESPSYDHLIGQFLRGYWDWYPRTNHRRYLRENACRALRRISQNFSRGQNVEFKVFPQVLQRLPQTLVSREAYANAFSSAVEEAKNCAPQQIEITTLLEIEDVLLNRTPDERPRDRDRNTKEEATPAINTEIYEEISGFQIVTTQFSTETNTDDEPDGGADPLEGNSVSFIKQKSLKPTLSTSDDKYIYIGHSHASEAVARARQGLAMDYERLNAFDLEQLLQTLKDKFAVGMDGECSCYLSLLLTTGLPSHLVSEIQIDQNSKSTPGNLPIYNPKTGEIKFKTWSGQAHIRKTEKAKENSSTPLKFLTLRVPEKLHGQLGTLVPSAEGKLFSTSSEKLIKNGDVLLDEINLEFGTRLTMSRVSGFMFNELTNMPGGHETAAILLTGQLTHGGCNPAFYTEWQPQDLRKIHEQCHHCITEWANVDPDWFNSTLIIEAGDKKTLGSQYCPSISAIKSYASESRQRVYSLSNDPPNNSTLVVKHNVYIEEAFAFLECALGSRVVTHLILNRFCINLEARQLMISDKDDHTYYHCRIFRLSPTIVLAFTRLFEHLDALLTHLVHINPSAAQKLRWTQAPLPTGDRKNDLENRKKNPSPLFLLQVDGSIISISPEKAMDSWVSMTDLKCNSLRHAFRTYSVRNGIPDATIRANQGHWRNGEEACGKYSTLHPRRLRNFANGWVENQIRNVYDWSPPSSPLLK
jgi:hypothetical protein